MRIEQSELNKRLNIELEDFKKQNDIKSVQSAYLVTQYKELKLNLELYTKYCYNINDFKTYLAEKHELSSIVEEFFLNEVKNIDSKRDLKLIHNEKDKQENLDYISEVSRVNTTKIGNEENVIVEESAVENIVSSTFKSLLEDADIIQLQQRSKELKQREEERNLRKANRTPEEKRIIKENKKISQLVSESMFGKAS